MHADADPAVVQALVQNHRQFLRFLEHRTRSREEAEDVLQAAFVRALEKGDSLREAESVVAWFYRLLRNALIDRSRADIARTRALDTSATDVDTVVDLGAEDPSLHAEACRCVMDLLPNLKPEYAELVRRVDLDGEAVNQVAQHLGITANNAGVRLHRARTALLREVQRSCRTCADHGCLDCSCAEKARPGERCEGPV